MSVFMCAYVRMYICMDVCVQVCKNGQKWIYRGMETIKPNPGTLKRLRRIIQKGEIPCRGKIKNKDKKRIKIIRSESKMR